MTSITVGSLEIVLSETPDTLRLIWKGEADERDPRKFLSPFLNNAARQAAAAGKELVLDFVDLQFMNSSSIGLAISFVRTLQDKGVPARFLYNTSHAWQKLSMKCTRTIFARSETVTIQDEADGASQS